MPTVDVVDKKAKEYMDALRKQQLELKGIKREGKEIIIPADMTYGKAAELLLMTEKQMEEIIETNFSIECHPHDGLICFYEAMKEQFGGVFGQAQYSFFGKIPPQTLQIPIDFDETIPIPYGKMKIVGLDIEFNVMPNFNSERPFEGRLIVNAKHKRMLEPIVLQIEKDVKARLKKGSIFKGKAVNSKLDFINTRDIDISRIVYARDEYATLNANIFNLITNTNDVMKHHASLRRTILLYGKYGTGKTLTARMAAKLAVENGWTFVNVLPGDDIVPALQFSRKNQPCLVFYEDIDQDTSGERDVDLNKILNELDGVLSKDAKVVVILTSNNINALDRAMLRPGRIDLAYEIGKLDSGAVVNLIKSYGGDNVEDELDENVLYDAAHDYPPAFVVGAIEKALYYALADDSRNGGKVKIGTEAIAGALRELRPQYDLMMGEQRTKTPALDSAFGDVIGKTVHDVLEKRDW